jgi:hypothetical protein
MEAMSTAGERGSRTVSRLKRSSDRSLVAESGAPATSQGQETRPAPAAGEGSAKCRPGPGPGRFWRSSSVAAPAWVVTAGAG